MRPPKVCRQAYLEAVRDLIGWCKACRAFTTPDVDSASRRRTCPVCKKRTVAPAENALLYGHFQIGG